MHTLAQCTGGSHGPHGSPLQASLSTPRNCKSDSPKIIYVSIIVHCLIKLFTICYLNVFIARKRP